MVATDGLASCGPGVVNTITLEADSLPGGSITRSVTTLIAPAPPLLFESFEDAAFPPAGWGQTPVVGAYLWDRVTTGSNPAITPHSGTAMARLGILYTLLTTPPPACLPVSWISPR